MQFSEFSYRVKEMNQTKALQFLKPFSSKSELSPEILDRFLTIMFKFPFGNPAKV